MFGHQQMKFFSPAIFVFTVALALTLVGCGGGNSGSASSSSDADELSQYLTEHPELDTNQGEEDMESDE